MWTRDRHNRGPSPEQGVLDAARVTTATQMRELAQLRGRTRLAWRGVLQRSAGRAARPGAGHSRTSSPDQGSHPTFRRRTEREGPFVVRDLTVRRLNRKWGVVTVPKVGQVRFGVSRLWVEIEAATSARVTHRNGALAPLWFTTLTRREDRTGAVVGIEGVKNTLALSDTVGEEDRMIQAPALTTGEQARLLALPQQLGRQQKGSARRKVTLERLAVLRRRLQDRRTDWVEQTTTSLARTYDLIAGGRPAGAEHSRPPQAEARPVERGLRPCPTGGTWSTGVAWVHVDHCPFGHLVFEPGGEPARRTGEDRAAYPDPTRRQGIGP